MREDQVASTVSLLKQVSFTLKKLAQNSDTYTSEASQPAEEAAAGVTVDMAQLKELSRGNYS